MNAKAMFLNSNMKLKIHCVLNTPEVAQNLKTILPSCEIVYMTPKLFYQKCENDDGLQTDIDHLLAVPQVVLSTIKWKTSNMKFVQVSSAGVDILLKGVKDLNITQVPFKASRFTGDCYGNQLSDYVICNTMNWIRHAHEFRSSQRKNEWNNSVVQFRQFRELTIGILGGTGAIGLIVSKNCKALGAKVWVMGRETKKHSDVLDYADEFRTVENMSDLLENCDVICSILPNTEATTNLLNLATFEKCQKKPLFINIGRSNVFEVDQLLLALEKGFLSGAVLDVFDKEPLDPDSKLWQAPGVIITPHNASLINAKGLAHYFADNLERFVNGVPLVHELDFTKSY